MRRKWTATRGARKSGGIISGQIQRPGQIERPGQCIKGLDFGLNCRSCRTHCKMTSHSYSLGVSLHLYRSIHQMYWLFFDKSLDIDMIEVRLNPSLCWGVSNPIRQVKTRYHATGLSLRFPYVWLTTWEDQNKSKLNL